ncbi:MAG TPA: RNA repair transcriptional activator RtcR [Phycisphaerae bacterium]|nr:RNA repair transcriptional activator RtcR [Phycisphaerae bacterium]HRY70280.1 RNA repair transcriptional activator RtcR [Phycisphaerae bacterium]HSA27549.1 RNA repair transcriptional activator RtcR [Phycisphaerae bacterium]
MKTVIIGMLATEKDAGHGHRRWARWRPTVALCRQPDLPVARLELLHEPRFRGLAEQVSEDIRSVSPSTTVRLFPLERVDPWDFGEAYAALRQFARHYPFNAEEEEYLIHVNAGTHVARICMFLLTESRHFPGRLIQSISPARSDRKSLGAYRIIDLDLSRYDPIVARFQEEQLDAVSFLKSGIQTRNADFNRLIEQVEKVAVASRRAILLTGPTGSGKSRLARRIFELKKTRRLVTGSFVEVNCATLRGDAAMSALFGHVKGAFTGALQARPGLLQAADKGVLFLDEIGELGTDEQAMLLRALEDKTFLPVGSDEEVRSDFQLIAGTNRDLAAAVRPGRFRDDLLARINLWTFRLPGLGQRPEDIEPNLHYELEQFGHVEGRRVRFAREAWGTFLRFAVSPDAAWSGNFRDLNGAIVRMATLAVGGRITLELVHQEIARLRTAWRTEDNMRKDSLTERFLGPTRTGELDHFDRTQLEEVLRVCLRAKSLSEAGRILFAHSRKRKKSGNDASRLQKYLARFGIRYADIWAPSPVDSAPSDFPAIQA